jgi:hypothetical protein
MTYKAKVAVCSEICTKHLTHNPPTTTIVAPPRNVIKWQMGFNSAFKGLTQSEHHVEFLNVKPGGT